MVQEHRSDSIGAGPCSDCGMFVEWRTEVIEGFTHSAIQLCATCQQAFRQRQAFAGGCCD
jgi:hypothetical protein